MRSGKSSMFFAMSSEGSFTFCDGRYRATPFRVSRSSFVAFALLFPVEPTLRFVSQQAALDHLR